MSGPTWSIPLGEFLINRPREKLNLVARKIFITAGRRIIMRTPVRTGAARGGWQFAIGSPPSAENGRLSKGGRAAMAELVDTGTRWNPISGEVGIMSNLVPYIGRLEHGSSRQAPNGMVALTVAEIGGIAQDAAAESQGGTWGGAQAPISMGSNWDIGGAGE